MSSGSNPVFQRINHVGVIVDDLGEARRWLRDVFGLPLRRTVDLEKDQIHGEFYGCGDIDIEIITIGDPEVRKRRLGSARVRIEHIAVEVNDLAATLSRLAALGVRTTAPEPVRSGNNLNAWTVEQTSGGISYQLIERGRDAAPGT